MQSPQWLILLASAYVGILFLVAWQADRRGQRSVLLRGLIYSLSLAVYCSSWTFFGAVGKASVDGWSYLPIYLGPILMFVLAWPFLRRLSVAASRNRVTSIADFIGSRFGKSQLLAALVTAVAVLGSLPYIALQLKATSQAWATVQGSGGATEAGGSASFVAAMLLMLFTVVFGTRVADERYRHRGLMAAIAVESVVKLAAFILVGLFAVVVLMSGLRAGQPLQLGAFASLPEPVNFVTQGLLAAAAIFCLPRQFHVMNVEHHARRDLRMARWLFPTYLLLFALIIVPLTLLGLQLFDGSGSRADLIVVSAPLALGQSELSVIALLGGLSAATGMVVVACLTLSIMICNEWLLPLWQTLFHGFRVDARGLQRLRRVAIGAVLLAAWILEQHMSVRGGLASLGLISFAAAAQLAPVLIASVYWPRAHRRGVLAGLLAGGALWCYCLLLPALLGHHHALVVNGPGGLSLLAPENLLGMGFLDSLSHGVFWSLLANTLCLVLFSLRAPFRPIDLRQARVFTDLHDGRRGLDSSLELQPIEVWQLQRLLTPLLGEKRSQSLWRRFESRLGYRLLSGDRVPRFVAQEVEQALAAVMGTVSAHRTLELMRSNKPLAMEEFVALIGNTSRDIQFGQDLMQITLETIPQGVSVVDADLNLVAWNRRYVELFSFPERLLYIGCPVARIYHFNAERGYLLDAELDVDAAIERRLAMLRSGRNYRFERRLPDGRMIEICGTPMASGGYVTTYTDISAYHQVQEQLEAARDELEQRVEERTSALAAANLSLAQENRTRARIERELNDVFMSKNRFMASASHDLLQPINAARLFTAALTHRAQGSPLQEDIGHIDAALAGAESLITSLREIAHLDSGRLQARPENFSLQELLDTLGREFAALADNVGLVLHVHPCSVWVHSDKQLLRRVVQNLLSNALRYTRCGRVVLGCRRQRGQVVLQVWDTGPGIAIEDQQRIFGEFERGGDNSHGGAEAGLGLGLSIVQRISHLLGHTIGLHSRPGRGSVFFISLPVVAPGAATAAAPEPALQSELAGIKVLCVDNEGEIRAGMQALLNQWQCQVCVADSLGNALAKWPWEQAPDMVLADYHLNGGETGLELLRALGYHWQQVLPGIVISADNQDSLRSQVAEAGYRFLAKPVKPAALRVLMSKMLALKAPSPAGAGDGG